MKTQLPSKCPWKSYRDPVTPWGFANPRLRSPVLDWRSHFDILRLELASASWETKT